MQVLMRNARKQLGFENSDQTTARSENMNGQAASHSSAAAGGDAAYAGVTTPAQQAAPLRRNLDLRLYDEVIACLLADLIDQPHAFHAPQWSAAGLSRQPTHEDEMWQMLKCKSEMQYTCCLLLVHPEHHSMWKCALLHLQAKADAKREYGSAVPRDGSLLHHLLRAQNKETGRPFSELEIMAQGNTFLLAGEFVARWRWHDRGCLLFPTLLMAILLLWWDAALSQLFRLSCKAAGPDCCCRV